MLRTNGWQRRPALVVAITVLSLAPALPCPAQTQYRSAVAPVSYAQARPMAGASVRFERRAPQAGDRLEQNLAVALDLSTMVRQNNQVMEQGRTTLQREQQRLVTTTQVVQGMPMAVQVRYAKASKQIAAGPAGGEPGEAKRVAQPVDGKTYRVRRDGDALLITNSDGAIPPLDEYEIVALNMDTLGRPNPLADFLAGRTVAVGERFDVPSEVAEKLMGLGGDLGHVTKFELLLDHVTTLAGRECAVFRASIEAASIDSSQMRLAVDGPLAIEVATCRAVEANFTGPIGMSETRGSLSHTYQMTGTGKMTVSMASNYTDVQR